MTDLIDARRARWTASCRCRPRADADYFVGVCGRPFTADEAERIQAGVLAAYRWQYIVSGVQEPRFSKALGSMITEGQAARIGDALAPIM